MKRNILVRGARQLLTLYGHGSGPRRGDSLQDLGVIEDGSVLIVNGSISSIGPTRRIENLAEAKTAEEISAAGQVVLPGFVDTHAQVLGIRGRSLQDRFSNPDSKRSAEFAATVQYLRNAPGTALEFYAGKQIESFLRHGTTTMEVKTGYGLNTAGELKMLRVLGNVNDRCVSVVRSFVAGRAISRQNTGTPEHLNWLNNEIIPRIREKRLTRFVEVACGETGLSPSDAATVVDTVQRGAMPFKVRAAAGSDPGPAIALAVSTRASALTGVNALSGSECRALAKSGTITTVLPCGVISDGQRSPAVRSLLDAGGVLALGSGYEPSSCSTMSMQMAITMACLELDMTPEEAICAATINAAHAAGVADRCGSLESGKDADLCILNVSDYRELPLNFGANLVSSVVRKGTLAYQNGAVTCASA